MMCLGLKRSEAVCYIMDDGYNSSAGMGIRPSIVLYAKSLLRGELRASVEVSRYVRDA
jgi:hypothetical protein